MPKPTTNHADPVPLNIWPCRPRGAPVDPHAVRAELAARVITEYSTVGSLVVDLASGAGEVTRAALDARRRIVSLSSAPIGVVRCGDAARRGRRVVGALAPLVGRVDLVTLLPPAERLGPRPRSFALSRTASRVILNAVAPLLRAGGLVAVGVVATHGDALTDVVQGAEGAGLAYFQHAVALLVPADAEAVGLSAGPGRRSTAHADMLVFARKAP